MTESARAVGANPAPNVIEIEPIFITGDAGRVAASARAASEPIPIGELATQCLSKLDGVVLTLVATPVNPVIGALVGLRAGLELAECATEVIHDAEEAASIRRAIERCEDHGGTPVGLIDGELTCEIERTP